MENWAVIIGERRRKRKYWKMKELRVLNFADNIKSLETANN